MRFLDTYRPQIFAAARIAFGVLFVSHGLQKAFMMFGGAHAEMPEAGRYLIGWMELVGGAMIAIGFKTRIAAFLSSGMMAVAYFAVHQKAGFLPIQTHGESAAIYSWAFLMIACEREWVWALDSGFRTAKT